MLLSDSDNGDAPSAAYAITGDATGFASALATVLRALGNRNIIVVIYPWRLKCSVKMTLRLSFEKRLSRR